ncbi:mannose-1-phosphate guanylyltransferase/mannose-6-phosphate isomerase [Prochlorococcus sp. AH-716-I17]|nr:mannose-1-phosphate guanylyltransferase/mannose-6-phosphate isomerase [Prochlorococcus sp. AH-716-I17]
MQAMEINKNAVLLVLSADHEIKDSETFQQVILNGLIEAKNGRIVTFGVPPRSPETGYGYIESVKEVDFNIPKASQIKRFIEKPDYEKAKKLIQDKRYLWNSGIFMFTPKTLISEVKSLCPHILDSASFLFKNLSSDLDFQRLDKEAFESCPDISIDFAIMEKTKLGTVVPLNCNWSDIGNWKSVWQYSDKDTSGNAADGNVIIERSKDCYFRSEDRLIVGLGLNNLFVIETSDTILIADKNESENVKHIVNILKNKNMDEGIVHKKVFRPWGYYKSIEEDERWQIKKIVVNPGDSLSLQLHHHRSEHWIIVKGTAKIEIDEKEMLFTENQSVYIPLGSKHRLSNPGKVPLTLIEVQSGEYLGEDDIIRFKDEYNRIDTE